MAVDTLWPELDPILRGGTVKEIRLDGAGDSARASGGSLDARVLAPSLAATLTSLTISNSAVAHLPAGIGQLAQLRELALPGNALTSPGGIPADCFVRMTQLTSLDLR